MCARCMHVCILLGYCLVLLLRILRIEEQEVEFMFAMPSYVVVVLCWQLWRRHALFGRRLVAGASSCRVKHIY